jgi:hypothetical protein
MPTPRRALTVRASVANLRSSPGPVVEEYALPLDLPVPFYFAVGSTLEDDGRTVLGCSDSSGAWLRLYDADKGDDLTALDTTLAVGDGAWRSIPAGTLVANLTLAPSTVNARAGATIEVVRLDVSAYTVALGAVVTLPAGVRSFAILYSTGTAWELRRSGLML